MDQLFDVATAISQLEAARSALEAQKKELDKQIQASNKLMKFVKENKDNASILPLLLGMAKKMRAEGVKRAGGETIEPLRSNSKIKTIVRYFLQTNAGRALSAQQITDMARAAGFRKWAPSHYGPAAEAGVRRGDYEKVGRDMYAIVGAGQKQLIAAEQTRAKQHGGPRGAYADKPSLFEVALKVMQENDGRSMLTTEIADIINERNLAGRQVTRGSIGGALRAHPEAATGKNSRQGKTSIVLWTLKPRAGEQ